MLRRDHATMPDPADSLAHALRLHQLGELDAAVPHYRSVVAQDRDHPSALYLWGLLDLQAGRFAAAADRLSHAASVRPDHPGTLAALAAARLQLGDALGALAAADATLRRSPNHERGWFLRGTALSRLNRPAEAAASLQLAIESDPSHAEAWLNLANALLDLDQPAEAERHCRTALALAPGLAEAHASLGHMLSGQARYQEAIAACAEAIRLRPDFAEAHWNQGIAHLLAGEYRSGWERYEWRKRHPAHKADFHRLPTPEWQGEELEGRTLLVTAEQGLGDTVQFARYLPLLRRAGAEPVLACAAPLIPLLSPMARCVPKDGPLPRHDLWIDQMSLPRLFQTRPDCIPFAGGYLRPDPRKVAAWNRDLPFGRRIGLVWAGNPAHSNDHRRSLPTEALDILAPARPGTCFIGLQVGPRQGEADGRFGGAPGYVNMSARLTDYGETAAALTCLDLLISVDTSVVHLAGALGCPAWVLLPHAPDWRWLSDRDDSPWYRSLRLFRQTRPGDWSEPLRQVASALS